VNAHQSASRKVRNCSEAISRPAYGLDLIGNSFRLLSTCNRSIPLPAQNVGQRQGQLFQRMTLPRGPAPATPKIRWQTSLSTARELTYKWGRNLPAEPLIDPVFLL
jgi:hypothetical protein